MPKTQGQIERRVRVDAVKHDTTDATLEMLIEDCTKANDIENLARLCREIWYRR